MVEHERSVLSPLDPCRKATLDELSGSHSIYGHLRHIRYSSLPLRKKKKHNQDTTKKKTILLQVTFYHSEPTGPNVDYNIVTSAGDTRKLTVTAIATAITILFLAI